MIEEMQEKKQSSNLRNFLEIQGFMMLLEWIAMKNFLPILGVTGELSQTDVELVHRRASPVENWRL